MSKKCLVVERLEIKKENPKKSNRVTVAPASKRNKKIQTTKSGIKITRIKKDK